MAKAAQALGSETGRCPIENPGKSGMVTERVLPYMNIEKFQSFKVSMFQSFKTSNVQVPYLQSSWNTCFRNYHF